MYLLMIYFNNYSKGAYIYLSLHGTYGLIWLLKDMTFPDKSMHVKTCLLPAGALISLLLLYWGIGFEMMYGSFLDQINEAQRLGDLLQLTEPVNLPTDLSVCYQKEGP